MLINGYLYAKLSVLKMIYFLPLFHSLLGLCLLPELVIMDYC